MYIAYCGMKDKGYINIGPKIIKSNPIHIVIILPKQFVILSKNCKVMKLESILITKNNDDTSTLNPHF